MRKMKNPEPQLQYYDISPRVTAFSSTRHGGVSEGNYASFNVNTYCGDDPEHIAQNRKALCKLLHIKTDRLIMPHQVHGTGVTQISKTFFLLNDDIRRSALEGIDALITNVPGVCIGVSTADCIPIIIYDPEHHAAGVVHSGWRGTVANIAYATVAAMTMAYHSQPEDVYEPFAAAGYPMDAIAERMDKWHIDLPNCCRLQLESTGIPSANIRLTDICTYDHTDDFFSARKLGTSSGRILTGIVLR